MFFEKMPNMRYNINGSSKAVKDIFLRAGFKSPPVSAYTLEAYYIENGETPDTIASKLYDNPRHHWIIFIVNNIVNYYDEWPKSNQALIDYVNKKYGASNINESHHYVITDSDPSIIVDFDAAKLASNEISAVSNFDYEANLNADKSQIFIVKPQYINTFVKQYRSLFK